MKTSVGLAVSATKDTRFCCTRSDIAHSSLDGPITLTEQAFLVIFHWFTNQSIKNSHWPLIYEFHITYQIKNFMAVLLISLFIYLFQSSYLSESQTDTINTCPKCCGGGPDNRWCWTSLKDSNSTAFLSSLVVGNLRINKDETKL